MRSYEAARTLFSILAFLAWAVVVIGGIGAMIAANSVSSRYGGGAVFMTMLPGFGISIVGLILVAFVQTGRASVDTAEYTQQMLKIARDQLEVSRQGLKPEGKAQTGFASVARKEAEKPSASFADQVQADKNSNASQKTAEAHTLLPSDRVALGLENGQLEYQTKSIDVRNGQFLYNGIPFDTLVSAQKYIDKLGDIPAKRLPPALNQS